MSEQPHYNTTPDQGWERMRSILDHEMPVTHRRRKAILFWRMLNTALILGVVGLGMYEGVQVLANKPLQVEETIPATDMDNGLNSETLRTTSRQESEPRSSLDKATPSDKQDLNANPEKAVKNESPNRSEAKEKNIAKPKQPEPMAFNSINLSPDHYRLQDDAARAGKWDINEDAVASRGSLPLTHATTSLKAESIDDLNPLRNGQVVDPVPTMPVDLIVSTFSANVGPVAPVLTTVRRKGISVKPYMALEGLVGANGGAGGQAGAGLDIGFSKRLTWNAGASYRAFSPNSNFLAGSRDFSATPEANAILNLDSSYGGFPAYIEGDLLSASSEYNAINPFVDQVRQWQVQTGLRYNLTKRFFTEGGIMHAFKTNVTSQYPILTGDPLVAVPDVRVSNSLNEFDKVRTSMTSFYAGIGFMFGKHFSVHARWTHGFQQYLLTDATQGVSETYGINRSDTIRGLGIGIKYTL